ncbi:cystine ABC transporter substrate-binding protein, partial [Burkholderia gladioli]|nr:cystine ABC transporter substrate-binding protein [Burkholderia gladioli]
LDDAISAMKQDGTLRKISMQWFGVDTSVPAAN